MKINSLGYRVPDLTLTDSQNEAKKKALEWYKKVKDQRANQLFFIAGYAGTGKSTITPVLLSEMGLQAHTVAFMTYTGKASVVLSQKTGTEVNTIHSQIYRQNEHTGNWDLRRPDDCQLTYKRLILLDEVSMVSEQMMMDIMSFGVPILCFGDPGQLPPIGAASYFNENRKPDVFMTEITRQALESPIIEIAHRLREGRGVLNGQYGTEVWAGPRKDFDRETFHFADQVICGKNDTRVDLNVEIRKELGYSDHRDSLPVRGEKLICLKNNHKLGTMNGQVFLAASNATNPFNSQHSFYIDLVEHVRRLAGPDLEEYLDGYGKYADMVRRIPNVEAFSGNLNTPNLPQELKLPYHAMKNMIEVDYGYAITTHKAQGSQWDNVLMINEPPFRDVELNNRWAYTSVTRAAKILCIIQ